MKTTWRSAYTSHYYGILFLGAIVALAGYFANIIQFVNADMQHVSLMTIARMVGVFIPPIGCVLGFF